MRWLQLRFDIDSTAIQQLKTSTVQSAMETVAAAAGDSNVRPSLCPRRHSGDVKR